jgi:hypothetical protein
MRAKLFGWKQVSNTAAVLAIFMLVVGARFKPK